MRILTLLCSLLGLASVALIAGCPARGVDPGESCLDAAECTVDEGQLAACVDRRCREVDCLSSADCTLGSYCSLEDDDFECLEGCQGDLDCVAGESCSDEGQCEAYGCRSTNLDCALGEVCNADSGECEVPDGAFCNLCDFANTTWDDQGTFSICDDEFIGHSTCGGTGAMCLTIVDGGPNTCLPACRGPEDCPRGHVCQEVEVALTVNSPLEPCTELPLVGQICIPQLDCADYP